MIRIAAQILFTTQHYLYRIWMYILSFRVFALYYNSSHWPKEPKHISFIFHKKEIQQILSHGKLEGMIDEMIRNGTMVSLYDKHGILKHHFQEISSMVEGIDPKFKTHWSQLTSSILITPFKVEHVTTTIPLDDITGRQAFVKYGIEPPSILNPELVFVVGPNIELQGYCPWLLALCEFRYFKLTSHVPFLDFEHSINRRELRRGIVYYAQVQQRYGN